MRARSLLNEDIPAQLTLGSLVLSEEMPSSSQGPLPSSHYLRVATLFLQQDCVAIHLFHGYFRLLCGGCDDE